MVENFESEVCERNNIAGVQLQESSDKNPAAFGRESNFENQSGVEADVFETELQVVKGKSHSSMKTDVSKYFSVASIKNDNIYGDNISVKSSVVQLKLAKSSQSKDLNKFQPTNESSESTSVDGLLTYF